MGVAMIVCTHVRHVGHVTTHFGDGRRPRYGCAIVEGKQQFHRVPRVERLRQTDQHDMLATRLQFHRATSRHSEALGVRDHTHDAIFFYSLVQFHRVGSRAADGQQLHILVKAVAHDEIDGAVVKSLSVRLRKKWARSSTS
jgi:hypothetical protein